MKKSFSLHHLRRPLGFCLGFIVTALSYADQNLAGNVTVTGGTSTGNLNVTGSIDVDGPVISFGTIGASTVGNSLIFADSTATSGTTGDTLTFSANRTTASWLWLHNASKAAMRLNSLHQLLLYQADGSTAGITLTPVSNQISFGTATLTGTGINLTAGGALTVTGALTASSGITNATGVFTGGASGLSFSAGGSNQNVTLTPSGTGYTILNGNVGIGNLTPPNRLTIGATGHVGYGLSIRNPIYGAVIETTGNTGASPALFVRRFDDLQTLFRVDNNGNVGIGTATPGTALDVASGIIRLNGVSPSHGTIYGSSLNSPEIFSNGGTGDFWFYTPNSTYTDLILSNAYNGDNTLNIRYTPGTAGAASGVLQIGQLVKQSQPTFTHGITEFFTNGIERLRINQSGNVGIGTTTPASSLDIGGGASYINGNSAYQLFSPTDKVVQVRSANQSVLSLLSDVNIDGGTIGGLYFGRTTGQNDAWVNLIGIRGVQRGGPGPLTYGDLTIQSNIAGEVFRVRGDTGNVGIGTTNPGTYKLAVKGSIHAKEIVVDTTGWSDYVFDKDYRLAPLSEVESHIKAEKHLPGIPSAAEVVEHGVSLGDMQSKLLAKVEELTLHLIAQEKRMSAQQDEIAGLRRQVGEFKSAPAKP